MAKAKQTMSALTDEACLEFKSFSSSNELDQAISKKFDFSIRGRVLECRQDTSFPWRDIHYFNPNSTEPAYFADIASWKRNIPDITLHAGGAEGPVAALSYFRWNRSRTRVGVGEYEEDRKWVELRQKCTWRRMMRFEWDGKMYALSRIGRRECKVFGLKPKLGGHLKMVEEDSGKVMAVSVCRGLSKRKPGLLMLADGLQRELEVLIVIAVSTWREIDRR